MNFGSNPFQQILNQVLPFILNQIPYPIDKHTLIKLARQFGANDQIVGMLEKLPNVSFNSAEEIQEMLGKLGHKGENHS
jgi:hypothetical protein